MHGIHQFMTNDTLNWWYKKLVEQVYEDDKVSIFEDEYRDEICIDFLNPQTAKKKTIKELPAAPLGPYVKI